MSEADLQKLQLLEQNIQQLLVQKQSFQSQLIEVESALEELKDNPVSWKIIGNIMVQSDPEKLKESLTSKKQKLGLHVQAVDKQEEKLRDRAKSLQQSVMEQMKNE